jgi:replicative DNA helicase
MVAAADTISQMARVTRTNQRQGHQVMQMDEAMGLVVQRLENTRGSGGMTGIESGWAGLDLQTGGYQNSDLISIVARMGIGKTYLLLKQAKAAHAAGYNVLFVTTEMGAEPLARRYASIEFGINPTLLKMNMVSTWNERRIRGMFQSMAGAERFRIFSVGMNSKISAIEALCQEFYPDIVFIDGIYLLRPSAGDSKMKRIERIAEVFDETKALNLEMERPFVVSTQLNRQAGKGGKDGSLETISYTDSVGTHSSIVIAARTGPTDNPWASRWLEFLKGREGEHGKIAINFKFAPLDMGEFTPEQAAQEQTARPDLDWMNG